MGSERPTEVRHDEPTRPAAPVSSPARGRRSLLVFAPGDWLPAHRRYRVTRLLGRGSAGCVYEAVDARLGRAVAVKIIDPAWDERRVRREAKLAANLHHPAIVALYEFLEWSDGLALVYELVDGPDLARAGRARRLGLAEVLGVGAAVADALAHAHARGVVHRDVKPQNVLLVGDRQEGAPPAKLADFGVAGLALDAAQTLISALGERGATTLTTPGEIVGTLAYMAPEQATGGEVQAASDIWGLGACLYELLTGVPFANERPTPFVQPRPIEQLRPDLGGELTNLVGAMLAPRPGDRPQAREVRALLSQIADRTPHSRLLEGHQKPALLLGLPAPSAKSDRTATARTRELATLMLERQPSDLRSAPSNLEPAPPKPPSAPPPARAGAFVKRLVGGVQSGCAVLLATTLGSGASAGTPALVASVVAVLAGFALPRLGAALVIMAGLLVLLTGAHGLHAITAIEPDTGALAAGAAAAVTLIGALVAPALVGAVLVAPLAAATVGALPWCVLIGLLRSPVIRTLVVVCGFLWALAAQLAFGNVLLTELRPGGLDQLFVARSSSPLAQLTGELAGWLLVALAVRPVVLGRAPGRAVLGGCALALVALLIARLAGVTGVTLGYASSKIALQVAATGVVCGLVAIFQGARRASQQHAAAATTGAEVYPARWS